jgi:glycosyltransferase involved in cell wall biosynthesis
MRVTVAICTFNRAELLRQTLDHLRRLEIPRDCAWELIVVNNRSTDPTDEVVRASQDRLPLRLLSEPRQGKSHALNTAMAAANGELLLWTDDDVLVDPRWLAEHVAAARRHPEAAFFGGPIVPVFEVAPPAWIGDHWPVISGAYAARTLGDQPFAFRREQLPFGANLCVRTSVQRRYPYLAELGPSAANGIVGEETNVLERMLDDGHVGMWVPAASVQHFIVRERLTIDYIRRYFHGLGRTAYCVDRLQGRHLTVFSRAWLRSAVREAQYLLRRPFGPPDGCVAAIARVNFYRGYRQAVRSARRARDPVAA